MSGLRDQFRTLNKKAVRRSRWRSLWNV